MNDYLIFIAALGLTLQAIIGFGFLLSCIWEKEKRASIYASLQFSGMFFLLGYFLYLQQKGFFKTPTGGIIFQTGFGITLIFLVLLFRKTKPNTAILEGTSGLIIGEVKRQDEREIVFARNRTLRPGSKEYNLFYKEFPQYKEYDETRRLKGSVLGHAAGATDGQAGHINVAMTLASAKIPDYFSSIDKTDPIPHFSLKKRKDWQKIKITPEEAVRRVKGYAKHLGAKIVGVTEINPLWIYSKRGEIFNENWDDWGKEIKLEHPYAIVFGTEMAFEMVRAAPHTPTTLESNQNYAKAAYISTQLAAFISNMGYRATANHRRHADTLLVPLAVDAGLGEISRMGYLVTKELGPRLRLGAVTTDLPLIPDKPVDIGVEDFCKICKKCANSCPSRSIPDGEQIAVNGILRWKLNEQKCFSYWAKIGTDCNICMRVCPWSHARTFPHKLIVQLISRNSLARRLFSFMDDIFYGKFPPPNISTGWSRFDGKN